MTGPPDSLVGAEAHTDAELDVRYYAGLLYKGRWVIAACALVAAGLGVVVGLLQVPVYRTSALLKLDPPAETEPERVPVTEASKSGVLDPMTATLVRMPAAGEVLSPEACQRRLPVFDGRLRYDLNLAFKRMDSVGTLVVDIAIGKARTAAALRAPSANGEGWLHNAPSVMPLTPFRGALPIILGERVIGAITIRLGSSTFFSRKGVNRVRVIGGFLEFTGR